MLSELTVKEFLEKVASKSAVPGGGSVSALCGALGAGLCEMVANITMGKKDADKKAMENVLCKGAKLREELTLDIDKDSKAFEEVMAAFKLPKETEPEKTARKKAIEEAFKRAALVPMQVASKSMEVLEIAKEAIEKGNPAAFSDAGTAKAAAIAAFTGAAHNVRINIASIKDDEFNKKLSEKINDLEKRCL